MGDGLEGLRPSLLRTLHGCSFKRALKDSLAKRSKAVAQGAIPKGRGFEPHSCHFAHAVVVHARTPQTTHAPSLKFEHF